MFSFFNPNKLMQDNAQLADDQRLQQGAKAQRAYDGEFLKQLTVEPNKPDDNTDPNYAETVVDKGVSFLFGQPVNIEIGAQEDASGETYLDTIWPKDERQQDLLDWATNGGIYGTAWLKIALTEGKPQVIVLDPQCCKAEWSSDNYKVVERYVNQYNTLDENGKAIIRRERCERVGKGWTIYYEQSQPNVPGWVQFAPPVLWNYPFAPFFCTKNLPNPNQFYGRPDLTPNVIRVIERIHRVEGLIDKIIRIHATPKPVAKGLNAQDLKLNSEGVLFLPDKEQDLKLLEMTGDLGQALERRRVLREVLAEITHVPEVATGKLDNVGQLSGLALQILYGPLLKRTDQKRLYYGATLVRVVKALLALGNKADLPVSLNWPNPLPQDAKGDAETAVVKQSVGVSQDTLLRELGYDADEEREKSKLNSQTVGQKLLDAFNGGQE